MIATPDTARFPYGIKLANGNSGMVQFVLTHLTDAAHGGQVLLSPEDARAYAAELNKAADHADEVRQGQAEWERRFEARDKVMS